MAVSCRSFSPSFPRSIPHGPDIKAKWFEGFGQFMAGAKNNGG